MSLKVHAIVTPGEAPETDDELDPPPCTTCVPIPHELSRQFDTRALPLYDSALHSKLRETQVELDANVKEVVAKQRTATTKTMQQVGTLCMNTQATLQDSLLSLHRVADNLYLMDANIDSIIASVHLWPDFDKAQ